MKNYKGLLKAAAISQLANALIHLPSLFISPLPGNETEKQLFALMDNYRFNLGAGFHRTMNELVLVFSACLCLLCLVTGLLNLYLLKKGLGPGTMKGVVIINLLGFSTLFALTVAFTFILPIVSVGLVVVFLTLALLAIGKYPGSQREPHIQA